MCYVIDIEIVSFRFFSFSWRSMANLFSLYTHDHSFLSFFPQKMLVFFLFDGKSAWKFVWFDFYADAFIPLWPIEIYWVRIVFKSGNYTYNLFMYVMIKQLIQVFSFSSFSYALWRRRWRRGWWCWCSWPLLLLLLLPFSYDLLHQSTISAHCEIYAILYDTLHYGIMDWSRARTHARSLARSQAHFDGNGNIYNMNIWHILL